MKAGSPGLAPASFTIVMGTGAFAISTLDMAQFWPELLLPARIINYINFILFPVLCILAIRTWPRSYKYIRADFEYPHQSAFYAALGISLLVLGVQALEFGPYPLAGAILWGFGCFLTFVTNFVLFFRFFVHPQLKLDHFTPVFFIPVGGLAVIPVGGVALMNMAQNPGWHDMLLLINTLAAGSGILFYLGLFCLLLQRHFLTYPLEHRLAPTVWIHMAPIGWSGVGVLALGQAVCEPRNAEMLRFIASLFWGGAMWWFVMAVLLTLRAVAHRGLQFSFAWWAFIFPLGAVTVLSFKLGAPFNPVFYFLWGCQLSLWLLCVIKTVFFVKSHFGWRK